MGTEEKRGFATLSQEERVAIARAGGQAAHRQGRAHEFTPREAQAAGRLGGAVIASRPGYLQELGRRGGLASAESKRLAKETGVLPDTLRRALRDLDEGKPGSHQIESVRRRIRSLEDLGLIVRGPGGWIRTDAGRRALAAGSGS